MAIGHPSEPTGNTGRAFGNSPSALALLIAIALGACDRRPAEPGPDNVSIAVAPAETSIVFGQRAQFRAVVTDNGLPSTAPVRWSSSDSSVAAVGPDGDVVASGAGGPVLITARVGDHSARVPLSVVASAECGVPRPIAIGETKTGSLASATCPSDSPFAIWQVTVPRPMVLYAQVRSTAFDPGVAIWNSRLKYVAYDLLRLDGINPFGRARVPAGTYFVLVLGEFGPP